MAQWEVVPPSRTFDELTSAGTFVPTIEMTFRILPSGTQSTVKVPEREFTPERVRQLISVAAAKLAAAEALTSEPGE